MSIRDPRGFTPMEPNSVFGNLSMAQTLSEPDTTELSWDELHHRLIPLLKADNHTNIVYIALEYACLVAVLGACYRLLAADSAGQLTTLAFLPLCVVGMAVIGAFQHRLSGLGHEACHYALFKNRLANELVSDLLCMFPLMAMTQRFRITHLGHHQFLNDPNRDPDIPRLHFDGDRAETDLARERVRVGVAALRRVTHRKQKTFVAAGEILQTRGAVCGEGERLARQVARFGRVWRGAFLFDQSFLVE